MTATHSQSSTDRRRTSRWEPRDLAPLITLAALIAFFWFQAGRDFARPGTLTLVLQRGAVQAIVAVGLTFVLLCGEIDLSVGYMALWTACFCGVQFALPLESGGTPYSTSTAALVAAVGLPLLTAAAFGLASGAFTVASRLPSFIITLAMMFITLGLSKFITGSKAYPVPEFIKALGNQGVWVNRASALLIPYNAILAGAIMLAGHVVLRHTRFGRYVYMTGGNREAARLAGVRTNLVVIACLALSALSAGVAGLVNAGRLESVSLDQNADLLLNAVACVVLGGTSLFGGEGGMGRTLVGVLTFSVLQVGLELIKAIHLAPLPVRIPINDLMRPFLMGTVLLAALVINGLLARRRSVQ